MNSMTTFDSLHPRAQVTGQFALKENTAPDPTVTLAPQRNRVTVPGPPELELDFGLFDELPPFPDGIEKPDLSIDWDNGQQLMLTTGDFWVSYWTTEVGDSMETHNSIDASDGDEPWPADWTEEQTEQFDEWARAVQERVHLTAYSVMIQALSGHVAEALLAGASR